MLGLTIEQLLALITGIIARLPEYIALGEKLIALWDGKEPTTEEQAAYAAALDAAIVQFRASVAARRAEG